MNVMNGDELCELQGKTAAWTFTLDPILHDTCNACQTSMLDCKLVMNILGWSIGMWDVGDDR